MRMKKKFLAVIVVVMLAATALVASMVVSATQDGKVAYVSVKMDRPAFHLGENVTFQLYSITPNVEFEGAGRSDPGTGSNYYGGGPWSYDSGYGIHIVRIPDQVDPDDLLTNQSLFNMVQQWDTHGSVVNFSSFSSSSGPLDLSWDGNYSTSQSYGPYGGAPGLAISGNYLIYPYLRQVSGHHIQFMLDRNAIFHYDSVGVAVAPTYDLSNGSVDLAVQVTATASLGSSLSCDLASTLDWGSNMTTYDATFELAPGGAHGFVLHSSLGSLDYQYYSNSLYYTYSGTIVTALGTFNFNFNDNQYQSGVRVYG